MLLTADAIGKRRESRPISIFARLFCGIPRAAAFVRGLAALRSRRGPRNAGGWHDRRGDGHLQPRRLGRAALCDLRARAFRTQLLHDCGLDSC